MEQVEVLEANLNLPKQKIKVAAYARVSSEREAAQNSIENQITTYTEQIKANPLWDFVGVYADNGISGTLEMRPAFQQMLRDCRAGKINMIITKSFSRFARNTVVLLKTLRELTSLKIDVVFENDHINSLSQNGELLISLIAAYAQAESCSASENQLWRIKKMFEAGLLPGGTRLGYYLKDGVLQVIPQEAEIVKQIYNDYLSGMGLVAIAKKLNSQGVRTKNNNVWRDGSVRGILRNEKYIGDMILWKKYRIDYISKKRIQNRGEHRMYYVKNSHEAIISQAVATRVKQEAEARAGKFKPKYFEKENYLFSGLITCGKCGRHYFRKMAHSGSKYAKPVWICYTFNTWGKEYCQCRQIPEAILEAKTAEVLGAKKLDLAAMSALREIRVPAAGRLLYVFKDGHTQEANWENPSRRESWTEEMRQKARECIKARYERRNACRVQ